MLTHAATVAAAVVMAGFATSAEETEPATEVLLVATDDPAAPFAFEPVELTVAAGTTVRWRNDTGEVFHTVTFTDSLQQRRANGVFDASVFAAGDIVEFTFEEPGTYAFFCQPHSEFMAGTIVVTPPASPSTAWRYWAGWIGGSLALVAIAVAKQRRAPRTVLSR